MRILVLHNAVAPGAAADVADVEAQVDAVVPALEAAGHRVAVAACCLDLEALRRRIDAEAPDAVFNLVESLGGEDRLQFLAPALLDALGLPYTGSPTATMLAATDKLVTKRELAAAGLPVPPCLAAWGPGTANRVQAGDRAGTGPVILKSIWDHGSPELDDRSVLPDLACLEEALAGRERPVRGPCFAEPYVAGREINVSLLARTAREDTGSPELEVLPPAEIHFEGYPPGKPRIVGFRAKWAPDSFEFRHTPRSFTFPHSDRPLLAQLEDLALRAASALGVTGYARVDFRVAEDGRPFILEVNTNPCLSPDAGFAAAVRAAGLSFEQAVGRILGASGARSEEVAETTGRSRREAGAEPACSIRDLLTTEDPGRIGELLAATGYFRAEETAIGVELAEEALARGSEASGYHFLLAERRGRTVGYSCFGPVPMTTGTWDLYWIAVDPREQGRGIGRELLAESERRVRRLGGSQIFVDTSGRPDYAPTRAFYRTCGYRAAAELADFYAPGDGKVIFQRLLGEDEAHAEARR